MSNEEYDKHQARLGDSPFSGRFDQKIPVIGQVAYEQPQRTHFADEATLAYIATVEAENKRFKELLCEASPILLRHGMQDGNNDLLNLYARINQLLISKIQASGTDYLTPTEQVRYLKAALKAKNRRDNL